MLIENGKPVMWISEARTNYAYPNPFRKPFYVVNTYLSFATIIDCERKARSAPLNTTALVETDRGYHYVCTPDTYSNHYLQDPKFVAISLKFGYWSQRVTSKDGHTPRQMTCLNPDWKEYVDEWNRLAAIGREYEKLLNQPKSSPIQKELDRIDEVVNIVNLASVRFVNPINVPIMPTFKVPGIY